MSCYGCKDTDKSLAARLNKRITLLRRPGDDEWPADSGNEDTTNYDAENEYAETDNGSDLINDWIVPAHNVDDYGQPIEEMVEACTIWAAIEPLQGREYFAAMQVNADVTTRIRIRYREGIDRTMIARYKDKEFEILYIIHPQFAKKELQLMCKERQ